MFDIFLLFPFIRFSSEEDLLKDTQEVPQAGKLAFQPVVEASFVTTVVSRQKGRA